MTYVLTGFVLLLALHIARRLGWATDLPRRARWGVGAATLAIAAWAGLSGGFARGADNAAALRLWTFPGLVVLGFLWYLLLGLWVTGLVSLVLRVVDRGRPRPMAGGVSRRVR